MQWEERFKIYWEEEGGKKKMGRSIVLGKRLLCV